MPTAPTRGTTTSYCSRPAIGSSAWGSGASSRTGQWPGSRYVQLRLWKNFLSDMVSWHAGFVVVKQHIREIFDFQDIQDLILTGYSNTSKFSKLIERASRKPRHLWTLMRGEIYYIKNLYWLYFYYQKMVKTNGLVMARHQPQFCLYLESGRLL